MSETREISNREIVYEPQTAKDFVEKIFNLKSILSRDLLACDAKWTLFVSAALSYRYDSQLKPFPSKYITASGFNIDGLINVINETPALKVILATILNEDYDELDIDVVELLHWVLIAQKDPSLRRVSREEFDIILSKTSLNCEVAKPTHVLEVCPSSGSKMEEKFQKKKDEFNTLFAFHGSKLDSFYSILNHGLHQHMCKNALFGEGIYLSSELSVSLNFSPNGAGWGASECGSHISCVALCEYVNNPQHAKSYQEDEKKNTIPKKYIVISNNDVVRVRYLMFYGSGMREAFSPRSIAIAWINRNRYFLTVCCYTLFLASIGIANSGNGLYIRHLISKRSSDLMRLFRNIFSDDT